MRAEAAAADSRRISVIFACAPSPAFSFGVA
jgi:hypothetical protein